jgi:uncharacterized protein (TIGR02466 family)
MTPEIMLFPLFAIPVFKKPIAYQPRDIELDYLQGLELIPNMGNLISRDQAVLAHPLLQSLAQAMTEMVDRYVSLIYAPGPEVHLQITQSWINLSEPGQWHHPHCHPNSLVSGVWYVRALGDHHIRFLRDGYRQIELVSAARTEWMQNHVDIAVSTGDCVLFPSSLQHQVMPVPGHEPRISLSFNTFPVGVLGDHENRAGVRIDSVGHAPMIQYHDQQSIR